VVGPEDCFSAVGALCEAKLLTGTDAPRFLPDQLVSRAQALVWIVDALGYKLSRDADSKCPSASRTSIRPRNGWGFQRPGLGGATCCPGVANAYRLGIVDLRPTATCIQPFHSARETWRPMLDRAFTKTINARTGPPKSVPAKAGYPSLELKSEDLLSGTSSTSCGAQVSTGTVDGISTSVPETL